MKKLKRIHFWFYFFRLYGNGRWTSFKKAIAMVAGDRVMINPPGSKDKRKVKTA